ncbi:MAG: sigma-70 family RNA polymerase sigma factor [bacterium]|nr:sigma-70 family RNA polymerase sigma factor [Myxococcales bacterium]
MLAMIFAALAPGGGGDLEVTRLLRGDRGAARSLLRRLTPVIQARVRGTLRRRSSALAPDDVVQEVWVVLMQDDKRLLRRYDPARGTSLEGYVGGIADRVASDAVRRSRAAKRDAARTVGGLPMQVEDDTAAADISVLDRDLLRRLFDHLEAALPRKGRLVLRYVFGDGLSTEETADALGVSQQVVHNWKFRIRQDARAFLAEARGV